MCARLLLLLLVSVCSCARRLPLSPNPSDSFPLPSSLPSPRLTPHASHPTASPDPGKLIAAVCHGPAGLLGAVDGAGKPLLAGRTVACFTAQEEDKTGAAGACVGGWVGGWVAWSCG